MLKTVWTWFFSLAATAYLAAAAAPPAYIENKGQWPVHVLFGVPVEGGMLFIEQQGTTTHLFDLSEVSARHASRSDKAPAVRGHVYHTRFTGADTGAGAYPSGQEKTYFNYFIGDDPSRWAGGCRSFGHVRRPNVWPGVAVHYYHNGFFVKYDFEVASGSDPSRIGFEIDDADTVFTANGRLVIKTSVGEVWEQSPLAYQMRGGVKEPVACEFRLIGTRVDFVFPRGYDRSLPLVVDPELVFSTYSGSFSDNFGYTATYDNDGYLYSGGSAFGNQYPTTSGAYQSTHMGGDGLGDGIDMGLSKYDISGTFMVWSTYLGGQGDDLPHSVVVNDEDELFVYGCTGSNNFPVTAGAVGPFFIGGALVNPTGTGSSFPVGTDIVVARFNAACTNLLGSTYLGGSGNDGVNTSSVLKRNYADEFRGEISLDAAGNPLVVSSTYSDDFPVTNAFQPVYGGGQDAVVMKLNPDLTELLWSTYLGSVGDESGFSVTENSAGEIYLCGGTLSQNFPATEGAFQELLAGGADGFIARLSAEGDDLLDCTFYGSTAFDQLYFIEIDEQDNVYVYGQTNAPDDFFIINAGYSNPDSGMLLAKFSADLGSVVWSTVFGTGDGKPNLSPAAFLVDYCNRVYVSGWGVFSVTSTLNPGQHLHPMTNLPVTADAYDNTCTTGDFYMAVFDDDMSELEYATFFGGGQSSEHVDGGTSRFDRKGVIYQSVCAGCGSNDDFPIFPPNAVSPTNNSTNCNNGVYKFDFQLPLTVADFLVPPVGCVNAPLQFQNTSTFNATNLWDFGDGTTSTLNSPVHTFADPGLYEVTLVVTHPGTCNAVDTVVKEIEIILPTTGFLDDLVLCFNETAVLGPEDVDPNADYQWLPDLYLNDDAIANPLFTPGLSTAYTLLVTHAGCVDTLFQEVEVVSFTYLIPSDTTLCDNATLTLAAAVSDDAVGVSWSDQPDFSNLLNDGPDDTDITVSVDAPVVFYFRATLDGCTVTDEVSVNLVSFQTNIQGDFTACEGDTVLLSIQDPNPLFVYHWTPESLVVSGQDTPEASVLVSETTEFFVFSETPYDCTATDSVTVTVSDLTNQFIDASANPEWIVQGQSTTLFVTPGGYSYQWSPAATLLNAQSQSPTATPLETTIYTVVISDGDCSVSDTAIVRVLDFVCGPPSIYVPNAFTPNRDARNEFLFVRGNNLTDLYFVVYNRWGEKVFETTDQSVGWDGYFRDRAVDPDVFVYYLEATCLGGATYFEKGNITVLR